MEEATRLVNDQLDRGIKRIMRLNEEKRNLMADIKEVKDELKSQGFEIKIINAIIKLAEMEDSDRQELDYKIDTYREAAGIAKK